MLNTQEEDLNMEIASAILLDRHCLNHNLFLATGSCPALQNRFSIQAESYI